MGFNKQKLKIAILDQSPDLGGAESSILTLLKNMDRNRFEVNVILPGEGTFSRALTRIGIPVKILHLPMALIRLKRGELFKSTLFLFLSFFIMKIFLIKLCVYLRRNQFQLVITNTIKAHLYGSLATRLCSIPLLWRFHDVLSASDFNPLLMRWIPLFGRIFPIRILAVSRIVRDRLIELGISGEKIEVIFNGIDEKSFMKGDSLRDIRKEYGLKNGTQLIGCIGRIIPQKGQKVLLSALPKVIQEIPEAHFLIIGGVFLGEEGYQNELFEMIQKIGLKGKVTITGFQPDIGNMIQSLDLVVFPSITPESFGLVLIEAMSLKKPIVASDTGGVREIIEDGVHGFLVEPNRPDLLAERIIFILQNPEIARQLGEKAKERVHQQFSLINYIKGMEHACYRAVFKGDRIESGSYT